MLQVFSLDCEQVNPTDCGLMLVEPLFNLPSIQKSTYELVFEDFGLQSLCVGNSPAFTHAYQAYKFPTSLLAKGKTSLVTVLVTSDQAWMILLNRSFSPPALAYSNPKRKYARKDCGEGRAAGPPAHDLDPARPRPCPPRRIAATAGWNQGHE